MIFVDTGAWFARSVAEDAHHLVAQDWFTSTIEVLLTTDYVIDKLLTLLRVRGYSNIAYRVGNDLFAGDKCLIEYVGEADIEKAWAVFSTYRDKAWSFTDCVSRVVMERLGITTACAFDEHFRQFGSVDVVPAAG